MSTTHRAIVAESAGVLTVEQRPTLEPQSGQVRLEVQVAGINPADTGAISGGFGPQLFPYVAGCEYAAVVTAIGPDVVDTAIGERVAVLALPFAGDPGGWQDSTVIAADRLARIPADVPDEIAGFVPLVALTASTLVRAAALPPSARAAVVGAGGGVGRWVTQLLVRDGVEVIAIASAQDLDELRSWGAVAVDRDDAAALASLVGYDAVLDVAGGDQDAIAQRRTWLSGTGRYLSITAQGEGIEFLQVQWDRAALEGLLQGIATGAFSPGGGALYAPTDAAAAVQALTTRAQTRAAIDFRIGRAPHDV